MTAPRPRLMPSRAVRRRLNPLADLDVPALLDLVRSLRSAQLTELAGRRGAAGEVRALALTLDGWLAHLGHGPALPVLVAPGDFPDDDV